MTRVVIVTPLPPQQVGEAPYAARLIQGLLKSEKIQITALTGEIAAPIDNASNIEYAKIWNGRSLLYPLRLFREITKRRPHLVHVQFGPYGKVYGGLFGEPMLILLALLRFNGIPTTVTLHSTWLPHQVETRAKTYGFLSRLRMLARPMFKLYMHILRLGTRTIQLSTSKEQSKLREYFLREYEWEVSDVLEIPHPFVTDITLENAIHAAAELGLKDRLAVLVFGFIRRGKGIETAIRAIMKLRDEIPEVMLIIAGKPQDEQGMVYMSELVALVDDFKLSDNVRFDTRFIPEADVPLYYASSSLVLVPYTDSVGVSGPVHNYAILGTPFILSDAGYHNEEVLGGDVVLFESGNAEDLARKMQILLTDKSRRLELAKRQMQYALSEGWDLAVLRTLRNYRVTLEV